MSNPTRQLCHASHLPVLELLFQHAQIKNVFEYGCGNFSTNFFITHAESVTSVEMNKIRWYEEIKNNLASDKLTILFKQGQEAIDYFNGLDKKFDLVFIDGDGRSRKDCTQNTMKKSDIIAVHDIDLTWRRWRNRGWLKLEVPDNYKIITMNLDYPAVTIYTTNDALFTELKKHKSFVIKGE